MAVVVEGPRIEDALRWEPAELVRVRVLLALRRYWMRELYPSLADEWDEALGHGAEPATLEQARPILDALPSRNRFLALDRYIQLRLWSTVRDIAQRRLAATPDLLEPSDGDLGTLRTDPDFTVPDYYGSFDFHRQEGGIWRDDLGALVYAFGARVIHVDSVQPTALHDALAARAPDDLEVHRAVDLACGFGKTTLSLAQRYPDAEVIGVDLSAPVLRLGRKLATERGHAIDWVQADAADVPLEDGSADLVTTSMSLHELPLDVIVEVCAQAHRLLRPGGVFLALETRLTGDPFRDVLGAYHSEITGEPHINAFRAEPFDDFARRAGFTDVELLDFRPPGAPPRVDRRVWSTSWSLLRAIRS